MALGLEGHCRPFEAGLHRNGWHRNEREVRMACMAGTVSDCGSRLLIGVWKSWNQIVLEVKQS